MSEIGGLMEEFIGANGMIMWISWGGYDGDNWAIQNTPIPSDYTTWLIGFPTMGYHNPQ